MHANSIKLSARPGRTVAMLAALMVLTGCVTSVYPWYQDSEVAFDPNLAGSWVGVADDVKGCAVSVTPGPGAKQCKLAFSTKGCNTSSNRETVSLSGQLLQIGQQRFLDFWDDDYWNLHTVVKVKVDGPEVFIVPMDTDSLEKLMRRKPVKREARIDRGSDAFGIPDDVLVTSSTLILHKFLRAHAEDKELFNDENTARFHRQ